MISTKEVTNDRRTKNLPKIIFGQLCFAIIISAVALTISFFASGNRFDWKNFRLIKTGIIVLKADPADALVYINGQKEPFSNKYGRNFTPGRYEIIVQKDDYSDWSTDFRLEPESVNLYEKIVLFFKNPTLTVLTDPDKIKLLELANDLLAKNASSSLLYNEHEIWYDDSLIARFEKKIDKATLYVDSAHVIYAQEDEIRSIEITGKNDTLLLKLPVKPEKLDFVVGNEGEEIYLNADDSYYTAKIR